MQESTDRTDSAPFIEFMLRTIIESLSSTTPPKSNTGKPMSRLQKYRLTKKGGALLRTKGLRHNKTK